LSPTAAIIAFTVLDLAAISAFATVCVLPFRLGLRPAASVAQIPVDRLAPERHAAAWSGQPAA